MGGSSTFNCFNEYLDNQEQETPPTSCFPMKFSSIKYELNFYFVNNCTTVPNKSMLIILIDFIHIYNFLLVYS